MPAHSAAERMYSSSTGFSPRRNSFVSGGRWYGGCDSRAISSVDPSPPASRYSCAAMPAARPPPTITFWNVAISRLSSLPSEGAQRDQRQHTGDAKQYSQFWHDLRKPLVAHDRVAQAVCQVVER